jgi:hypothetical protein
VWFRIPGRAGLRVGSPPSAKGSLKNSQFENINPALSKVTANFAVLSRSVSGTDAQ